MWSSVVEKSYPSFLKPCCSLVKIGRSYLLDHTNVGLHVHHVTIPPVVFEAQHQGVGLETAQSGSLNTSVTLHSSLSEDGGAYTFGNRGLGVAP